MITTIRYILLTALRDWLFIGLFCALFAAFGISAFLGDTALVEEAQMRISYAAGSTRVILLIGMIIFVCFHVRTAFANREIELILSRPISRTAFVIAYWLGFSIVGIMLIAPVSATFLLLDANPNGLFFWTISLIMEVLFIVSFALFSSLILRSAVSSVLLCFGFYFVARMMGFFTFIIDSPHQYSPDSLGFYTSKILWAISTVLPRLDEFGKSSWLIYGINSEVHYLFFLQQTIVYIPFLLALALYDFNRKQF